MASVSPPSFTTIGRILVLALVYFIAGRLALFLAIPPGFATAIFPPLGISLAAVLLFGNRLLIGVLLGSVLLNTNIALSSGAELSISTFLISLEIATGSCLATFFGATMIRRNIGFPNDLTDEWNIFVFFMIGGPLASSISASVGVTTLYCNGLVPAAEIVFSWLTWWTGDTIGVLIATPLVFILCGQPRKLWRNRITGVGIPMVISTAIIVIIFFNTSRTEQQNIQNIFRDNARELSERLFDRFDNHIKVLTPLKGLYLASDQVSARDFNLFTNDFLLGENAVNAVSWNQVVNHADRQNYELAMAKEGYKNFFIAERNSDLEKVPANERSQYIVVTYIEPYEKNKKAHGLDVAADKERKKALLLADTTGKAAMTAPLSLIQNDPNQLGYLIYSPVYKTSETPRTLSTREHLLRGYVTSVFMVKDQIIKIKNEFPSSDYSITVTDITDANNHIELYSDSNVKISSYAKSFLFTLSQTVAGRELQVSIWPTQKLIDDNKGMQSWYVLAGGLLFCSLLGGFLLLVTGRSQHIETLVELRTLELQSILNETVEAIIIFNSKGHIERANPAACVLLKEEIGQLIGHKIEMFVPVLREIYKNSVFESGCVWKAKEATVNRTDATNISVELGVSVVVLSGRMIFTCIIHDISEWKKVDKLKNEFISTVSHELRTPLTSISGALGILAGGSIPNMPATAMDLLIIAKKNSDRLGRLVNDILDIEKLEFGQLQFNLVEHEVNELLQLSIEKNAGYAAKYGVHLALDNMYIDVQKIIIRVDQERFLQVMNNLISNAIKFSSVDGIVTVSAKVANNQVTFYVEDRGAGIPENFRRKVFQKFALADSSDTRKRDGTGLGLSISKVIVERMGGVIDYTSEVEKGTVFYFSLPLVSARRSLT